MESWAYTLKTKDGTLVGVTEETFNSWQKTYTNLNLYEVMEQISNSTYQKQWLNNGKQWIFQLVGLLAGKNEKANK